MKEITIGIPPKRDKGLSCCFLLFGLSSILNLVDKLIIKGIRITVIMKHITPPKMIGNNRLTSNSDINQLLLHLNYIISNCDIVDLKILF